MIVPSSQIGAEPAPMRWSTERFLTLVESGVIAEGRGVELIDGQVMNGMPQGELHYFVFAALQRVFASLGLYDAGLVVQPTIVLANDNVFDPEFAQLKPETVGRRGLPRAEDVLWIVEVAVSSRNIDLNEKKHAYALSGIPHYWVVDAVDRGVWVFDQPAGSDYAKAEFRPAGETLLLPLTGASLDTVRIFPPAEAAKS